MQLNDDDAFVRAAIARIERNSEELAKPLPEPISTLALGGLIALSTVAGVALFVAGVLLGRWL